VSDDIDIHAINLHRRMAVLTDGSYVPITNLIDCAGMDTDNPDEAVTFVAGAKTTWRVGLIRDFSEKTN
jgi:hypothetical protein